MEENTKTVSAIKVPECSDCKHYYTDAGYPFCALSPGNFNYAARYPNAPCGPEGKQFKLKEAFANGKV